MTQRNDLCNQLEEVFRIAKLLAGGADMSLTFDLVRRLKHICERVDLEHLNSAKEDKELLAGLHALFENDPAALLRWQQPKLRTSTPRRKSRLSISRLTAIASRYLCAATSFRRCYGVNSFRRKSAHRQRVQ
jgi:hypothetical protein